VLSPIGVTWGGKGGIWPSPVFCLPQNSFSAYCVEERQIKNWFERGEKGCLYIRTGSKQS